MRITTSLLLIRVIYIVAKLFAFKSDALVIILRLQMSPQNQLYGLNAL